MRRKKWKEGEEDEVKQILLTSMSQSALDVIIKRRKGSRGGED